MCLSVCILQLVMSKRNGDIFDISNWMDYGWMFQQMVSENHVLVILETLMVLQKPIPC